MDATDIYARRNWEHVHRCPRCGHIIRADLITHSAVATGVIMCLKCEYSGPINIEIVSEGDGSS